LTARPSPSGLATMKSQANSGPGRGFPSSQDFTTLAPTAHRVAMAFTTVGLVVTTLLVVPHLLRFWGAKNRRLMWKYLAIIALPLVYTLNWALIFYGPHLTAPWETAVLLYEPVALWTFLYGTGAQVLFQLMGGQSGFVAALMELQPMNHHFAFLPAQIRPNCSCFTWLFERPFTKNHIRFAKHGIWVASAAKWAYAVVLWLWYRTDGDSPHASAK